MEELTNIDEITNVTNNEDNDVIDGKQLISKDFLITKGQKKSKQNETNPLFIKMHNELKEFCNHKIQLMMVMKAQELSLTFKSEKKYCHVNTTKDIGMSFLHDSSKENLDDAFTCIKGQFESGASRFQWAKKLENEFMEDYNYMYQDDSTKIKGCIERFIVRRRQEIFKSVLRRGDPTNKLDVTNNKDHVLHNIDNNDELRQKMRK